MAQSGSEYSGVLNSTVYVAWQSLFAGGRRTGDFVTILCVLRLILRKRRLIRNFYQCSPAIKFHAKFFTGAIKFWFFCCRISSFMRYLKGLPPRFAHYGHNFPLTMYKLLNANSDLPPKNSLPRVT